MSLIPINLVFEDDISEFVMSKILDSTNKFLIRNTYPGHGFGYIKTNIIGFNEASKGCPFFVLTDLDNSVCPPVLIQEWFRKNKKNKNLIFRIALREVEAWLLADKIGFVRYTGVSRKRIPNNIENINEPKEELINIIRYCRKRKIREDIIPKNEFASIGPNYNERLMEFVLNYWDINRACQNSKSLRKTLDCLNSFEFYNY
ncbi:MAG: hypothetical protein V1904_15700 [Bacteroidota bacterium]